MNRDCILQSRHIRFPPSTDHSFDLLILGAGCAGLSLAYNLSINPKYEGRVLLVDSRLEYKRDRSWCFFSPEDPSLVSEDLISHRWPIASVRRGDEIVRLLLDSKPYTLVEASTFYQRAFEQLHKDSRFSIALGYTILEEDLVDEDQKILIRLGDQWYSLQQVVDSRSDRLFLQSSAQLWQIFLGYEIETDKPSFLSEEATLMDFVEDQSHVVSFMYELPTTSNRALLEYTVFSDRNMDPEKLSPLLQKAMSKRLLGENYRILRSEKGVIPMGLADPFKGGNKRRLRAGLMAGAARPSTGYAFLRIQRWARDCAESLMSNGEIQTSRKDPLLTSTMDKIFLRALKLMPYQTSSLFLDLFKNTPSLSLARFLNDEGRLMDHIYVIKSLPKRPFIGAVIRRKNA